MNDERAQASQTLATDLQHIFNGGQFAGVGRTAHHVLFFLIG
jgi:hypothetical protein